MLLSKPHFFLCGTCRNEIACAAQLDGTPIFVERCDDGPLELIALTAGPDKMGTIAYVCETNRNGEFGYHGCPEVDYVRR